MSTRLPRVVLVTRPTLLESLVERYGTRGQVEFVLRQRGQTIGQLEEAHHKQVHALAEVTGELPPDQRRSHIERSDLPQFLFAPDDVVVVVGQDGLVANVAKYLQGQRVLGVNPDPDAYDGVLCRLPVAQTGTAIAWAGNPGGPAGAFNIQSRTMAEARRDDGLRLLALNEIFMGHRSHQSARYVLLAGEQLERQSSSGLICATGTGATGWARSITLQRNMGEALPAPSDEQLAWFVREPFPSVSTGTRLDFGVVAKNECLEVISEMGEGGTLFADGIEQDSMEFLGPQKVTIAVAKERLELVIPQAAAP
jgi:NAD kinase